MRPQMPTGGPRGAPREIPKTAAREAPRGVTGALPRWESFSPPDRLRLVGLLIQTARRQVQPGTTGRANGAQG